MQKSLNKMGANLAVDNVMGDDTLLAINRVNAATLNAHYLQGRKEHYEKLVAQDPSQAKFFNGWMARLEHFPPTCGSKT